MRRIAAFAFVVTAAAAAASACHKSPQAATEASGPQPPPGEVWLSPDQVKEAKIETAVIGDQDVDDTILTSGRVTFDDLRVAHVFSPVSGKVNEINKNAQLGARVKKGDPLAVIESPDIGSAVSDLHKAEADLLAAEHDFKRERELAAKNAGMQKDLEQSEDNYRKALAEMQRAKQKTLLLKSGGVNSVSQTYTLGSPIDGEVIMRAINPGMEVQGQYGGQNVIELFTVGKLDQVWVVADIYEMDLARVRIGSKVNVKVVAYKDRVFEGRVDWVSGMLDPMTRTAKVRCTFVNPCSDDFVVTPEANGKPMVIRPANAPANDSCKSRMLKPEMYATVQISVDEKRALAIPRNAILRLGEQTVVFTEVGNTPDGKIRYERVPVSVDEGEASDWLPVQHGLQSGAKIVTNGSILLSAKL